MGELSAIGCAGLAAMSAPRARTKVVLRTTIWADFMGMMITPLQQLLRNKARRMDEITQATGRSRYTVRRWKKGLTVPSPDDSRNLIALFGPDALDFNGCYSASIEVQTDG